MTPRLSLRQAMPGDALFLWELRNAPDVRAVSGTTDEVPWASHVSWFNRALADPLASIYVGRLGLCPIGYVRFHPYDATRWAISIALIERCRGNGYGSKLIKRACRKFGKPVVAIVKEDNEQSARAFVKAGLRQVGTATDPAACKVYEWHPVPR